MRIFTRLAARLLDRVQFRLTRARPGSVLILVVVLVVLLALLGTASLSTTRGDRYTAIQNSANTQVDLIVEGVAEMARGAILRDLYGQRGQAVNIPLRYRPQQGAQDTDRTDYSHVDGYNLGVPIASINRSGGVQVQTLAPHGMQRWDRVAISGAGTLDGEFVVTDVPGTLSFSYNQTGAPAVLNHGIATRLVDDSWLSQRIPNAHPFNNQTTPLPIWSVLGRLPGVTSFDSPLTMKLRAGLGNAGIGTTDLLIPTAYTDRHSYTPVGSPYPVYLTPQDMRPFGTTGAQFSAFVVSDPTGTTGGRFVVAGDADGDGMADSGLFKVPIGEVDGVTYYAAVRIIDNNSAININTAGSQTADLNFATDDPTTGLDALGNPIAGGNNLGIFPSHVGLLEMMSETYPTSISASAKEEYRQINRYRRNDQNPNDMQVVGTDFSFVTQGDALASQLARLIKNPGEVRPSIQYRPFGIYDSGALAYHLLLQNRDVSPSPLEGVFNRATPGVTPDSVYKGAPNAPERPAPAEPILKDDRLSYLVNRDGIGAWFFDNFNYGNLYTGSSFPLLGLPPTSARKPSPPQSKQPIRALLTTHNPVSDQIVVRSWQALDSMVLPSAGTISTVPGPGNVGRRIYANTAAPAQYSFMTPYRSSPTRTNINTATFDELWRAFWCVMMDNNADNTGTPFLGGGDQSDTYAGMQFDLTGHGGNFASNSSGANSQRMFRSSLRDPQAIGRYFSPKDMVLLRSAIAAVQAMQLRGPDGVDPSYPLEQPTIYERIEGLQIQGMAGNVRVTIFGARPQPFITEVFVWRDTKTKPETGGGDPNPVPYVAIELYNPFPVPVTLTDRFHLAMTDRTSSYASGGTAPMTFTDLNANFNGRVIQPGEFLLIDNSSDMNFMPPSAEISPTLTAANRLPVSGLDQIVGGSNEVVLYEEIEDEDNPGTFLKKPIDSFDFHGFLGSGDLMSAWHYARPCGGEDRWKCVYPGRYWVHNTGPRQERHQGTNWAEWNPDENVQNVLNKDPWTLDPPEPYLPTLGRASGTNDQGAFSDRHRATINAQLPIQLANMDFGGPGKPIKDTGNKFPFGGFMRNGDILQVPYIGAYTISIINGSTETLLDMNSISMDVAFAEDSDPLDDGNYPDGSGTREQVGRFCPIQIGANYPFQIDDYDSDITRHRYAWAKDLFDYVSVNTPSADFLPQYPMQRQWVDLNGQQRTFFKGNLYSYFSSVSPVQHEIWECLVTGSYTPKVSPLADPSTATAFRQLVMAPAVENTADAPAAVPNATGPDAEREDGVGVQGLININTAPWRVLAAIPWVPAGTTNLFGFDELNQQFTVGSDSANRDDNEDIARAIVYWRDGNPLYAGDSLPNGPFRSLFDLYRVRVPINPANSGIYVFDAVQRAMMTAQEPDDAQGDFTPYNPNPYKGADNTDHARYDFEEQYSLLTKVSNLLTTRSDSFTVYIEVQGWTGVGTVRPELKVRRRTAFMLDRSKILKNGGAPMENRFPNE